MQYVRHRGITEVKISLPTVIFKTTGTHGPEAYNLREIKSPAAHFNVVFRFSSYFKLLHLVNTTQQHWSWRGWGGGECERETALIMHEL